MRRLATRLRNDRGAVTAELVLVTPMALTLVLLVVQFGLWLHAQHLLDVAAVQALNAARVDDGTAHAGTAQAEHVLGTLGHRLVQTRDIDVRRGSAEVDVRIEGRCLQVVPFLTVPVAAEAHGPVEQLLPATPRRSP